MKRYILFGFSLLVAFPLAVFAQDEEEDDENFDFLKPKRTVNVKKYETRSVKGLVIDTTNDDVLCLLVIGFIEMEFCSRSNFTFCLWCNRGAYGRWLRRFGRKSDRNLGCHARFRDVETFLIDMNRTSM